MRFFSLPADFKEQTIDRYAALNSSYKDARIITTYGNITVGNLFGSGRDIKKLPEMDLHRLSKYVEYSQRHGIEFNYTMNASYMQNAEFTQDGMKRFKEFLGTLYSMGIQNLTIAIPSLIELIRSFPWKFKIKASVITQITSPNKALAFKKMGVDSLVIDEMIIRNFPLLKSIRKAFGEQVEIIVNSICHQDCQYRMFHYNQISGDSVSEVNPVSTNYYTTKCVLRLYEDLANFLRLCWVRPEDLHLYESVGIQHFKIQGRQAAVKGDPARAVEAYMRGSFEGNFNQLLLLFSPFPYIFSIDNRKLDAFIEGFVKNAKNCLHDCGNCGYCEAYAKKIFNYSEAIPAAKVEYEKIKKSCEVFSNNAD